MTSSHTGSVVPHLSHEDRVALIRAEDMRIHPQNHLQRALVDFANIVTGSVDSRAHHEVSDGRAVSPDPNTTYLDMAKQMIGYRIPGI